MCIHMQVQASMMRFTWLWIAAYFGCACVWDWVEKNVAEKNGTAVPHTQQAKQFRDLLLIVLLLCCVNLFAVGRKYYLEKGQQTKFIYDWQQREATQQIFRILEYMVPVHVIVPMLKKPGSVIADEVKCASILFVMPAELLDYLNSYFTQFDKICAQHEVTKIETVGEEYVCAVGVVPRDWEVNDALGHAVILHRLIKAATEILQVQRDSGEEVKLKMGIHTGPVVAGVIGQKLPRFRLFGDTINTAARIMQKGLPGELQFGKATKDNLPPGVKCRFRDNIEMKGKGKVPTWLLGAEEAPHLAQLHHCFFFVECEDRGMFRRAEMEKEKTRPNSKFSTLSNPNAEGVLCRATAHQEGLLEFLLEVQKNHISFEQWIYMIRKEDFPDTDIGWDIESSDAFLPLNEIRPARACATLMKPQVCQEETRL
eukprot:s840_g5.t1